MKNRKGIIYGFFPVNIIDGDVIAEENNWRWIYFHWLFMSIFYFRNFIGNMMGIDDDYFIVKIKEICEKK